MLRLFWTLFVFIFSFTFVSGADFRIPEKMNIWNFSVVSPFKNNGENFLWPNYISVIFFQKFIQKFEWIYQQYLLPLNNLAIIPTVDRSLSYHLRIQEYALSCEITALRIILESLWIFQSEDDIFRKIPLYPFVYETGGIWWDPDSEFVWFYTWGQTKKTGYGIYEKPLANFAQQYWLDTRIINQWVYSGIMNPWRHLADLLQDLEYKNRHIILWWDWCTDKQYEDGIFSFWWHWSLRIFPVSAQNHCDRKSDKRLLYWITPENKKVIWLSGEHAFVLLGYVWTIKNPTHIIVWDTYTWRHVYPYSEWMRKWSLLQYRSLIVSSEKK